MDIISEVARLRQQIALEYEAARNGLSGIVRGYSKHQFINARMARIGELQEELEGIVGDVQAVNIVSEVVGGS